jgi:hypothetical protein
MVGIVSAKAGAAVCRWSKIASIFSWEPATEVINGIFERLKQGAIDGRIDDADGLDKSVWTSQATVNAVNC